MIPSLAYIISHFLIFHIQKARFIRSLQISQQKKAALSSVQEILCHIMHTPLSNQHRPMRIRPPTRQIILALPFSHPPPTPPRRNSRHHKPPPFIHPPYSPHPHPLPLPQPTRHLQALEITARCLAREEFGQDARDHGFQAWSGRAHDAEVHLDALPCPEVEALPGRVGGFVGYD